MTIHTENFFQEEELLTFIAQPQTDFNIYAEEEEEGEDEDYEDDGEEYEDDGEDYDDEEEDEADEE